jgi:hypothetical protein
MDRPVYFHFVAVGNSPGLERYRSWTDFESVIGNWILPVTVGCYFEAFYNVSIIAKTAVEVADFTVVSILLAENNQNPMTIAALVNFCISMPFACAD